MLLFRIHGARNAAALELREELLQELGRHDPLPVVADQDRVGAFERCSGPLPDLGVDGGRERLPALLVGAEDLLVVGEDPGFQSGPPGAVADDPRGRVDAVRSEEPLQVGGRGVVPERADQDRLGAERAHVLRDVGRAAQAKLFFVHVDDENRRLGGHARRPAPEIAVQDHVPDHHHPSAAEGIDPAGERLAGEPWSLHHGRSGRIQPGSPFSPAGEAASVSGRAA